MFVSTTVVSTRSRPPRTTRRWRARATRRSTSPLRTSGPRQWLSRMSVFASGTRSPSMRQNGRYTRLPRTSRSHSSKDQSNRCFRTSIRRTTSAGVPRRPRRRLWRWRRPRASTTWSTSPSSVSTASIARSAGSQSLSLSGSSTSTRLRWTNARRTICPPPRPSGRGTRGPRRPELPAIQLGQLPQLRLERLPRGHAGPDPRAQGLRHVVPGGGPGRPPKAHIEMGAVLRPGLAVAPGPAAGAVGLGQGAKDRPAGQGQEAAEQGVASPSGGRNRCHRLRSYSRCAAATKGKMRRSAMFGPAVSAQTLAEVPHFRTGK